MDKQSLTFLVVSMLVLMIYWVFVLPMFKGGQQEPAEVGSAEVSTPSPTTAAFRAEFGEPSETPLPATPTLMAEVTPLPTLEVLPEPETYTLETSALKLVFSTAGGSLEEVVLKEYEDASRESLLTLLRPVTESASGMELRSLAMSLQAGTIKLWQLPFKMTGKMERSITFQTTLPAGLILVKRFEVPPEDPEGLRNYHLDVKIELQNPTSGELILDYDLYGGVGVIAQGAVTKGRFSGSYYLKGIVKHGGEEGSKVDKKVTPGKPGELETFDRPIWAASRSQYFASLLQPLEPEGAPFVTQAAIRNIGGSYVPALRTRRDLIKPGDKLTHTYRLYVGPLRTPVLKVYPGYTDLQDYGFFSRVSVVLLAILHTFYRVTHNYGASIILLTILIRLVLFPISRKQAASSYKMQKLQPLMTGLREKHKNNKQKLNQEMMALYKEQGVNPLAGCLPVFLQLPIFIGLYRGLSLAIELRHAPFVSWISDLSRPDALVDFPFDFLGISTLNVLPLLMVGAMVWQQKFMPRPSADPQQNQMQSMFKLMPIFFGWLLYNVPSGLVLYWTTSTTFGVLEQIVIRRHLKALEKRGEAPAGLAVKGQGPKKKKFKPKGTK